MWKSVLTIALLLNAVTAASAELSLESVEQEVEALWTKVNSFTAKMTINTSVPVGDVMVNSVSTGTIECLKQDTIEMFRMQLQINGPAAVTSSTKSLSICDGKNTYSELEERGIRQAFKMPAESAPAQGTSLGGKFLFAAIRSMGDPKLLPSATLYEQPAFVVEVTPNERTKRLNASKPIKRITYYISKNLGMLIRMEIFDGESQPVTWTDYNDVKVNVQIAPDRFVYKAPEGISVQEISGK